MKEKTKRALKKQRSVLISVVLGGGLIAFGACMLVTKTNNSQPIHIAQPKIELPGDKMNPQDIWMNRVESQNVLIDHKLKYLEEEILSSKKKEEVSEKEKQKLKQEISQLKHQLQSLPERETQIDISLNTDPFYQPTQELPPPIVPPPPIYSPLVELVLEEPTERVGNVLTTIPAGTSVKALLVSSVDADCGVYSNSDPIPVKLLLLDNGHLPKDVEVMLKGGILIGSAYGNLSSERIYVRLERMTQVNPDGQFIETDVAGYVSGEDGKYGVRGTVVDKSQKIISNAAISGLFGEASDVLQSALGRWRIQNYTSTNQSVNDPFAPGACGSTCNAFDMLSDYYIRRAEQVKPVIQVNAGRVVDITFTHGVEIGELHTKEHLAEIREKSRRLS